MPSSYRLGICGVTSSRQQCPSDEADVCSVSSIGTVRRQCHCELHWNINGSDLAQRWCAYVHGVCGALAVGISLGAWRLEAGARTRRIGARGCRANSKLVCPRRLRIYAGPHGTDAGSPRRCVQARDSRHSRKKHRRCHPHRNGPIGPGGAAVCRRASCTPAVLPAGRPVRD